MISFSLFVILLIVLFPLSSRLKITIHQLFFSLTKSQSWSISLFSLLFFPGTLVHELSHFLIASLLLVPVSNLELVPKLSDNGKVRLGSVQIAKVDFLRRTIIGLAPLFAGLAVLWIIVSYFFPFKLLLTVDYLLFANLINLLSQIPIYHLLFASYFVFSISSMMFSSKKDLAALFVFIPFLLLILTILYLLGFNFTGVKIEIAGKITEVLLSIISQFNIILLVSIIISLAVFIFLYVLSKIFRLKTC